MVGDNINSDHSMEVISVRLKPSLVEKIDALVEQGYANNRVEFIRTAAIDKVLEHEKKPTGVQ